MQAFSNIGNRVLIEGDFEPATFSRIQKRRRDDSYHNYDSISRRSRPSIEIFPVGSCYLEAEPSKAGPDIPIGDLAKFPSGLEGFVNKEAQYDRDNSESRE